MAFDQYTRAKLGTIGACGGPDDITGVDLYQLIDPEPCACPRGHGPWQGAGLVLNKHNDAGDRIEVGTIEFDAFHASALARLLGVAADLALVEDSAFLRPSQHEHSAQDGD
jgi:hypothetical protein